MKNKTKLYIAIVIAVAIFIGALITYNALKDEYAPDSLADVNSSQSINKDDDVDYSAPDFVVEDKDGNDVTLSSYFGKPIVLNLWASWCSPCKQEMPYFEEAYKSNDDIQFMMVNMTAGDTKSDAKAFLKEEGYTFPVYYDIYGDAATKYSASSLPMTIFIDENGDLVTYAVGALNGEQLQEGIDLLK